MGRSQGQQSVAPEIMEGGREFDRASRSEKDMIWWGGNVPYGRNDTAGRRDDCLPQYHLRPDDDVDVDVALG